MQRLRLTRFFRTRPDAQPTVHDVKPQPSLRKAQEDAMAWCRRPGDAATVWRPNPNGEGTMRFRAWFDTRLQFIAY
jgi:hypothetical protein